MFRSFAEPIDKIGDEFKDYDISYSENLLFVVDSEIYIDGKLFTSDSILLLEYNGKRLGM